MRLLRTTFAVVLFLMVSTIPVLGFSTNGALLSRTFDKSYADINGVISATVTFTNGGPSDLRGFYYGEQIPSGLTVNTTSVKVNGVNVSDYVFEAGSLGDVYAGNIPYWWAVETPTAFGEDNPIPSSATVQIVYTMSSSGEGTFHLNEFNWVGYDPGGLMGGFGCSEDADRQAITFTSGPFIADLSPLQSGWGNSLKVNGGNLGKKPGKVYLDNPTLLSKWVKMKVKSADWSENGILSKVPTKVPSGYYNVRAVRREDGADAVSPVPVKIVSPLSGQYDVFMNEAYDTFPMGEIEGLFQSAMTMKLTWPLVDLVSGKMNKDVFEEGTFARGRFSASFVDAEGELREFFGIRVGDAIVGVYEATLGDSERGGSWVGVKKYKAGDISGIYALSLNETYDTGSSSGPGGMSEVRGITLSMNKAEITGAFGDLPVTGVVKNETVELRYTEVDGHGVVMRGVVVDGLIAGEWEGQDGGTIRGGTFNACKGETPESLAGNYRYYRNEQYDSRATDGPGGVSTGSLTVTSDNGATFSGTFDGRAFDGTLTDSLFEILSMDPLGNTVRLAGCIKDGGFVALWQSTDGVDKWGGSFLANRD
jgi:uncharacterized repeat protein (TIGR01451 family)